MSAGVVNPAIAKDLKNGKLLCMVCSLQVKSKTWIAHSNGRKHRENIENLKKKHYSSQIPPKRPINVHIDDMTEETIDAKRVKANIEADHFVEGPSVIHEEITPWQRDSSSNSQNISKRISTFKNVIEGVPEGFFDDSTLNNRVVETIEKRINMEQEYTTFINELDEVKMEEEEKVNEEEHSSAIEKDIEQINEQINQWKRVNQLEIRREEVYKQTKLEKKVHSNNCHDSEANSHDEGDEYDVEVSNWRSKGIC